MDAKDTNENFSDTSSSSLTRAQSTLTDSKSFIITNQSYQQQFSDLYFLRLAKLRKATDKAADAAWSDTEIAGETVRRAQRVLDVRQGQWCYITGTIYITMAKKPDILKDLEKEAAHEHIVYPEKYADDSDEIHIEDASGRIKLIGGVIRDAGLVTGCVVSVLGSETANGDFEVIKIVEPGFPPQAPLSIPDTERKGKSVLIVSGLNLEPGSGLTLSQHLLTEYLLGELGTSSTQSSASTITHLIIAGNSLAPLKAPETAGTRKYGYDPKAYDPTRTAALDSFLSEILPSVPVTVIPGANDPANAAHPQQPLHPGLVPEARRFDKLTFTTNPTTLEIDGVKFLGSAGQNIYDLSRYFLSPHTGTELLEKCLRWQCIAPTSPDTLWSYPFTDNDPFSITECPHVIFTGGMENVESEVLEGANGQKVRAVCLPEFSSTGECVKVDLETMETEVLKFGANV